MMTKMEMQYMDAVIQINRRQRNNEVDWEQRRYELAKAALFVAPVLYHDREEMTAEHIARYAVKICLLYTSPSPRDRTRSRMPSSA